MNALKNFTVTVRSMPPVTILNIVGLAVAFSIVTFTSWRVANSNPMEVLGKG